MAKVTALLLLLTLTFSCKNRVNNSGTQDEGSGVSADTESSKDGLALAFQPDDPYREKMVQEGRALIRKLAPSLIPQSVLNDPDKLANALGLPENFYASTLSSYLNPKPTTSTRKQDLMLAVNAVVWALYAENTVVSKSVAFSVKDDGGILAFLDAYKNLVMVDELSYSRDPNGRFPESSHLHNVVDPGTGKMPIQTGLDLRTEKGGTPLELLPDQKTHILYGSVQTDPNDPNTKRLYLKTERFGLKRDQVISHGMAWFDKSTGAGNYRGEELGPLKDLLLENGVPKADLELPLYKILDNIQDPEKKAALITAIQAKFPNDTGSFDPKTRLGSEVQINYDNLKTKEGQTAHQNDDFKKAYALEVMMRP